MTTNGTVIKKKANKTYGGKKLKTKRFRQYGHHIHGEKLHFNKAIPRGNRFAKKEFTGLVRVGFR